MSDCAPQTASWQPALAFRAAIVLWVAVFSTTTLALATTAGASDTNAAPSAAARAVTDDTFDQARQLRRGGRAGEAAALLQAQLKTHAGDGDYLGLLGLCLMDAGSTAEAAALAQRASSPGNPKPSASFRLEILKGRLALQAGNLDVAQEAFRQATRMNERAVEAWAALVRANMSSQRFGKALKNAERLEAVQAELGRRLGAEILRLQGDGYRRLGESTIELAADKYAAALLKTPADDALAELLLESQLMCFRLAETRELIRERFAADDRKLERHYWTGRCLVAGQDLDAAKEALESALAVDPGHARSALALAKLALDEGHLDAAQDWLALCNSSGLATAQTSLLMGEVLMGLDQHEAAEAHLRKASQLDPNLTKALYLLGRLMVRLGRHEEAQEVLARFKDLTQPPPVADP